MKKMFSILIALAIFLVTVTSAFASVSVTYNFDQQNVNAEVYACTDALCSNVVPFAGQVQSQSTDGTINIVYPTTLQTPNGYAVYFTSPGFIPKEDGGITLAGSGTIRRTDTLSFSKVSECKTTIDAFSVIDVSQPYMPITIQANTLLDAWTYSAFKSLNTGVEYVPPSLLDYYSADTLVTLTIFGPDGTVVHSDSLPLSIFVDSMETISFSWTPTVSGQHTAKIEVDVVDNQCSSFGATQSSTKQFEVLPSLPVNSCYTLLNQLLPVQLNPSVGDTVDMSFNKISNHANNADPYGSNYVLTPVETQVDYKVFAPGGSLVLDQSEVLPANSFFNFADLFTFNFPALYTGTYTIEVAGKATNALCSGLSNVGDLIQNTLFVETSTPPTVTDYSVVFTVVDSNANPINGAQVVFHGAIGFSDASGIVEFTGLTLGTYAFDASKSGFASASGSLFVNSDLAFTIVLHSTNNNNNNGNSNLNSPLDNLKPGLHVSSIRIPSAFDALPGTSLPLYLHFENNGDFNLKNIKATVVFQDFAVRKSVGPFNLKKGKEISKTLFFDLPEGLESGVYPLRLTIESEGVKRVVYREIVV